MAEKYLNDSGVELLWRKINKLLKRKIEEVEPLNDSINVSDKNKIAVNISASESNLLQVIPNEGLYVPNKMHKLVFGAHEQFVYDGSKDITVPVYDGAYHEEVYDGDYDKI